MLAYLDRTDVKPLDLEGFITAWKDSLSLRVRSGEVKQDTATAYSRGLAKFIAWHEGQETSPDVIREWKADLLRRSHKPAAINAWLAGLRSFFGWLAEAGQIPFDPTQAIPGATRKGTRRKHARECLTDREVIRLLSMPKRDTLEGKRDHAMISVMLYTAARGIELHRADLEDLKTVDGALVLYVQGKGHDEKDDFLVFPPEAESAMREWLAVRGRNNGALFTSCSNRSNGKRLSRRAIREIVKRYIDAAGIHGNKSTHSLRHTAITSAIRNNAPLQKVKGMSRHASIDTLMIYYHEADRLSDPAEKYISYIE